MRSDRSSSVTPALSIRAPPTPVSVRSGRRFFSALARPDAFRSPEASPAMIRTSRTRDRTGHQSLRALPDARQRWECAFDLTHDTERHGECLAAVVARHDHRLRAAHRPDETLELEAQRLARRRIERDTLDEGLERERALGEGSKVHVTPEAIELTVAGREIQRDVAALLKDPDLPHSLA